MTTDEKFMQRCNDLALMGAGNAAPNPMVGAVVVHNGKIMGEGYHAQFGQAHAEVNAINAVKNKALLLEATLYVNLEPCAHFGKTPPCADLIISNKIPRVVVGCIDSYAEVAGKGIARMEVAGINVTVGVLEAECLALNKRFFTFHSQKRPYVILKWAQSANGFMDIERTEKDKGIFWITQPQTRPLVHRWRHEEAAILVGKNTVSNDNPALTCTHFTGKSPVRLVIDQKLRLDYGAFQVGDRSVLTYIITEKEVVSHGNLQFVRPPDFTPKGILTLLYTLGIQSVIVEGGATTLTHFIEADAWDEARILTGVNTIEKGIKAPQINGDSIRRFHVGKDLIHFVGHA